MQAGNILTNIAIFMLAATLWDDLRQGGRITSARKTWLMIACIFAGMSGLLQFML